MRIGTTLPYSSSESRLKPRFRISSSFLFPHFPGCGMRRLDILILYLYAFEVRMSLSVFLEIANMYAEQRCKIGWGADEESVLCRPYAGISTNWVYIKYKFILVKVLISLLSSATSKQIRVMCGEYPYLWYRACCYYNVVINYRIVCISANVLFQWLAVVYSLCGFIPFFKSPSYLL